MADKFDPSTLPEKVRKAYSLGPLAWPLVVQTSVDLGERRADRLADIVFFLHHPERSGERIKGDEGDLIQEWMAFRELIRPIVHQRNSQDGVGGEGPLGGYVCSAFGGQANKRLDVAESRGCTKNTGNRRAKLNDSDILFFSGHHYARYDEPMHFDAIDLRKQRVIAPRVRLIMVSSCAGLRSNSLRNFRKRFPSAYIFGWLSSSPLDQKGLMRRFLTEQADTVDISTSAGISSLVKKWKAFVEGLPSGKGEVSRWGLGYATPHGKREWYNGSEWRGSGP